MNDNSPTQPPLKIAETGTGRGKKRSDRGRVAGDNLTFRLDRNTNRVPGQLELDLTQRSTSKVEGPVSQYITLSRHGPKSALNPSTSLGSYSYQDFFVLIRTPHAAEDREKRGWGVEPIVNENNNFCFVFLEVGVGAFGCMWSKYSLELVKLYIFGDVTVYFPYKLYY